MKRMWKERKGRERSEHSQERRGYGKERKGNGGDVIHGMERKLAASKLLTWEIAK